MAIRLAVVESRKFAENAYIVGVSEASSVFVVDPGFDPERIIAHLEAKKLTVEAIVLTHGHSDHIAGVTRLRAFAPTAPILIGRLDAEMLTDPMKNLSGVFGEPLTAPPADKLLDDGDTLTLAGLTMTVRHIPGHSPGHVVYIVDHEPKVVLGGDVLFAGSIGRTDFPGGSFEQLRDGIHEKLFTLPDDTRVFPGHGSPTTIGEERATNPFVGLNSRV
ncbi:MAG: MBL fold metallo-hydrolase [Fimbriiglobus sp.]